MRNFLHYAVLAVTMTKFNVNGLGLRNQASRVRSTNDFTLESNPSQVIKKLDAEKRAFDAQIDQEEDMVELMQVMTGFDGFSMTVAPTGSPGPATFEPSGDFPDTGALGNTTAPSTSSYPSSMPSTSVGEFTDSPTVFTGPSTMPSVSTQPSAQPTSSLPLETPFPSGNPTTSVEPSFSPTTAFAVTPIPTDGPTLQDCGVSPIERALEIMSELDSVSDSALIRDFNTPQGKATNWILLEDVRRLCQDNVKLIQRWVMAVMYFSTGGPEWSKCSADGADACGQEAPFEDKERFLSESNECEWAGISCNVDGCATEIEFEDNNMRGTIPSEIALLPELAIWGMEEGNLTGTIPNEIGELSNLIFLDLDFNKLTGSLPPGLFTLSNLTQLDLNNNRLTGSIDGIGSFPKIEFLQIHSNLLTGEIPDVVGQYTLMGTFNLHENNITGSMPLSVCNLLNSNGGNLTSLIADCTVVCDCCEACREVVP